MAAPTDTWRVARLQKNSLIWGIVKRTNLPHLCPHCGIRLLTGETSGFCCGPRGEMVAQVPRLQALPVEYETFLSHPDVSSHSRLLNLVFTFAQLESTHPFPNRSGLPAHFAVEGRIFHRVRPNFRNSAIRWLLYDGFMRGREPFADSDWFHKLPQCWIDALGDALLRVNSFVRHVNVFRQNPTSNLPNINLVLRDAGENEIAAVMCLENTIASDARMRSIVISKKHTVEASFVDSLEAPSRETQRISVVSRFWEPLIYPLLFPYGELGWGRPESNPDRAVDDEGVAGSQIWHCRYRLLSEDRFQIFGRLTNEYVCDMFTRNIESRLAYIRASQVAARREDAALMGRDQVPDAENVFLPSSFLGSTAWCSDQIADALTIASHCGVPTFFITMTCNPDWPEIRSQLRPGQKWQDIPLVIARVFKQKLAALLKMLKTMFPNAGDTVYRLYAVEFQKRGLPHCHILIKYKEDCVTAADIDSVVTAEMPDDAADALLVKRYMWHHHPDGRPIPDYCKPRARVFAASALDAPPTVSCRFGYPKPVQAATTLAFDGRPQYRRRHETDSWVVPHCLPLMKALDCHINFEVDNSSHIYQYLFKYIRKGVDRTHAQLRPDGSQIVDEIEDYWRARYLSAGEAAWRLLGFRVASKSPGVTSLAVHLPSSTKHRQYRRVRGPVSTYSTLDRYFHRPLGTFHWEGELRTFAALTYTEYYTMFRHVPWDPALVHKEGTYTEEGVPDGEVRRLVLKRAERYRHFVRIDSVRPSQGELFYLRSILLHRSASSFADARSYDGHQLSSYQEVAQAMGLFADRNEAQCALYEAVQTLRTPRQIRLLFVHLLVHNAGEVDFPLNLWEMFRDELSLDFYFGNGGLRAAAYSSALSELSFMLEEFGRSLRDFNLPEPIEYTGEVAYELDKWLPHLARFRRGLEDARRRFTDEQAGIFNEVSDAIENDQPYLAFIDGKAGRGKTFLITAICDYVRSRQEIVLPTATSAFAALLYEGGRTTHSCFKIPVDEYNELLVSPIDTNGSRADLIREARVIIWDESPMANRAALSCVEETCRRVTGVDLPFGGKIVILAGDFRQTCPVVRRGTRAQVVDASIRMSPLWELFSVKRLTIPIRNAEDAEFAAWVDDIGDGAGPEVELDLLRHVQTDEDLVSFVYPQEVIDEPRACLKRSILCPTNRQIDKYNADILSHVKGISRTYLAADKIKEDEEAGMPERAGATLDYAARSHLPRLPPHSLTVKTNAVFRLLRNFSIARGLVKNVRVVVIDVGARLVTVRILRDTVSGVTVDAEDILIPRITFEHFLPETHRTLQRRQFPLAPAYATAFNSCQGLTLDLIAVDLRRPVFSHGQLYTALSRVRRREHVVVRLPLGHRTALNVTYCEILL